MNQYLTKMKYQAHFNYISPGGEINNGISITQPGQAYSVKEALARIQKGLPVTGRNYVYQEEGEYEPPIVMRDLTDLDAARQRLNNIQNEAKERKKAKEVSSRNDQPEKIE